MERVLVVSVGHAHRDLLGSLLQVLPKRPVIILLSVCVCVCVCVFVYLNLIQSRESLDELGRRAYSVCLGSMSEEWMLTCRVQLIVQIIIACVLFSAPDGLPL